MPTIKSSTQGFTLIELLIVIAIISILAAVVFVALDPLTRFKDSRDAKRWADVTAILTAIKVDQVDNGGTYTSAINGISSGQVYMITDGANTSNNCDLANAYCVTDVGGSGNCVDLSELQTQGYIGSIPVSPNGEGGWKASLTGYTIEKGSNGIITIRACEAENTNEIKSAR